MATVLPGLEDVLEQEIRLRLADAGLRGRERGKVFFGSALPAEALQVLRTADNVYRVVHRFKIGPHKLHLHDLEAELSRLDLSAGYGERRGFVTCKVNASRVGKQTYSRFEAAEAAERAIIGRHSRYRPGTAEQHEVEFRLDIVREDALFALRLTDASFRYRGERRAFAQAALRPSVAHALVWLTRPDAADSFLDPCCGSGTIVAERLAYPYARIDGGDLSAEAAAAAAANVGRRERVRIHRWDARRLPVDAGCANKIAVNLPFGRQIAAGQQMGELYGDILLEMKRVLRIGGLAICLVDDRTALERAAVRAGFRCSEEAALSLKGLRPTLYRLERG